MIYLFIVSGAGACQNVRFRVQFRIQFRVRYCVQVRAQCNLQSIFLTKVMFPPVVSDRELDDPCDLHAHRL
jgi:hypothetical protein